MALSPLARTIAGLVERAGVDVMAATRTKRSVGRGLSLSQYLRHAVSNEPDVSNSKYVRVVKHDLGKSSSGTRIIRTQTVTRIPGQRPRTHHQVVADFPVGSSVKFTDSPRISATCDCPRWMFMWEWVANHNGAAPLKYGNGDPPNETNPTYKIGACKHLAKVFAYLTSRRL